MFKFALAAAISMMLMFEPAVAEAKSKSKSRATAVKRVHGVRIEFKTEEERSEFVRAAKKAQERPRPLPDL